MRERMLGGMIAVVGALALLTYSIRFYGDPLAGGVAALLVASTYVLWRRVETTEGISGSTLGRRAAAAVVVVFLSALLLLGNTVLGVGAALIVADASLLWRLDTAPDGTDTAPR